MSRDEAIARIAAKQHGAFSVDQARKAGLSDSAIKHRRRSGRWVDLYPRVYSLSATPPTWEQRVMAVTLMTGGVASSITAAGLLGIMKPSDGLVHVTLARGQKRRKRPGIVLHEARLSRTDVRTTKDIPHTAPNRTLVDVAAALNQRGLEAVLDDALQLGLTTIPVLDAYIRDNALGHNAGMCALRKILDDRAKGAMHKELERMFRRKLQASGFPEPVRQYPLGSYFIDCVWPAEMVAVELDGLGGHFSAEDFRRNKRKDNEIVLAGFDLLHFTWEDVNERWPDVERVLRAAHEPCETRPRGEGRLRGAGGAV